MNFYKHHIGDYLKDTGGLTVTQHGAYLLLLLSFYATERPLPADEVHAIAKATSKPERDAVDKVLAKYWLLTDEGYINGRASEEIAADKDFIQQQRDRANKRWQSNGHSHGASNGNATAYAETMPPHMPRHKSGIDPAMPPTPTPTPTPTTHDSRSDLKPKNNAADASSTSRGTRIPIPFPVTQAMRTWAAEELPGLDVDPPTVEFVDYWRGVSGAKGVKLDWPATWRNRMREVHGRRRGGNGSHAPAQSSLDAQGIPTWATPEERAQILRERKEQRRAN